LNGNAYHHINPCSITEINLGADDRAEMIALNTRSHIPQDMQ